MFEDSDRFGQDPQDAGPPAQPTVSLYDAVANLYRSALGREASPEEIQNQITGGSGDLSTIHQSILASDEYKQKIAGPGTTKDIIKDPIINPGPGPIINPGPNSGSLIQPFTTPYQPSQPQALPTMGGSQTSIGGAPAFPNIPRFAGPTMAEAMDDPGYQFVLDQGNKNLQNWAAAKGTLNDSSTAKALTDYGQGAAATQYGNVWDRAFNTYNTNVQTQYMDPWQAQYQNWMGGTVGPTMTNYSTNASNVAHQNDVNWQDNWNSWLQNWNIFRDQRDSTFNKQFAVAGA